MKKVIQRSVWLHWSAEKQNAEQAVVNVGRSEPNMQAVPLNKTKSGYLWVVVFPWTLEILQARGERQ